MGLVMRLPLGKKFGPFIWEIWTQYTDGGKTCPNLHAQIEKAALGRLRTHAFEWPHGTDAFVHRNKVGKHFLDFNTVDQ